MNARQKAKMYKKKCQELEQTLLFTRKPPIVINSSPVITLRAEQLVDMGDSYAMSASEECSLSALNKMLASQFLNQILNYAKVEAVPNPYGYFDKTLIRATMKVVDMRLQEELGNEDTKRHTR